VRGATFRNAFHFSKYELVIVSIDIPDKLLARADEVIGDRVVATLFTHVAAIAQVSSWQILLRK
jgi:hypothetical protein